jgi:hypothetical protein
VIEGVLGVTGVSGLLGCCDGVTQLVIMQRIEITKKRLAHFVACLAVLFVKRFIQTGYFKNRQNATIA